MNIKRLTIKDSSDQESKILFLVYVSWIIGMVKFIIGGWKIPGIGEQPVMDPIAFGTFTAGLIAVMAWRKWIKSDAIAKVDAAKIIAKAEVDAAKVIAKAEATEADKERAHDKLNQ